MKTNERTDMNLCLHVNCPVEDLTEEERQLLITLYKSMVLMRFTYGSEGCAVAIEEEARREVMP